MSYLLAKTIVEWHREGRMKNQDDTVENNLVTDRNIPIGYEIRIFTHTLRVSLEIIVGDEDSYETFEGNWKQICLNLNI